jgi:UDP-glucose:tetrahydrobiopterin glucosyltransferase
MKILWIGTAYGTYSDSRNESIHGGVTDCLRLMMFGMRKRGHSNTVFLTKNSDSVERHYLFDGVTQPTLASGNKNILLGTQTGDSLQSMIDAAWDMQNNFDLIVNMGHDWLPHFMVGKFRTPYLSLPNLCNTGTILDGLIRSRSSEFPWQVAFFSKAQRQLIGNPGSLIISQPFDSSEFPETSRAKNYLFWAGRVVPEKGLEAALTFAKSCGVKLRAAGFCEDQIYLDSLITQFGDVLEYIGLLERSVLYDEMSGALAFLQMQSSHFQEAFGRTTVEAMLCGCPVIYFNNGANQEIISSCEGGVLVSSKDDACDVLQDAVNLSRINIKKAAMLRFDVSRVAYQFEKVALHSMIDKQKLAA